ncbi:MAG: type I methionyl aminopeptidase [Hyphomicrobiales bacterium]|nr:MAG: type I methionyl aminopeptidase [Hyphomicrobiales bacterium]
MTYIDADEAPLTNTGQIKIYGEDAFAGMRKAGKIAAAALDMIAEHVKVGITTAALDKLIYDFGMDHDAIPATLNYKGYTHSSCISINHVICHGIPSDKTLKEGDILNIDITYIVDGWHGDNSRMYVAGTPKRIAERLINITYESLMRGMAAVKPGATTGDIGYAIQSYVESERMSVVRDFVGHGLGRLFHDAPSIFHFGQPGEGETLAEGMIFTIEPMVNIGKPHSKILADGWTAVTRDRSLSAQYEHSIGVTKDGCEIFTLSPKGYGCWPYE